MQTTLVDTEDLQKKIGQSMWLTQDYDVHVKNTQFELAQVTPMGDQTYVIGKSPGKKGLFAPASYVTFINPIGPPKQAKSPPESASDATFEISGYESDAPLMAMFKSFAPNTSSAQELYTLYQSELGEFDTDVLTALMEKVGLTLGDPWTDSQVKQMHIHLTASATAADLGGVPQLSAAVELLDPDPELTSEVVEAEFEEVGPPSVPEPVVVRAPGRPRGSKNKPKLEPATIIPPMSERFAPDTTNWQTYWALDLVPHLARLYMDHPREFESTIDLAMRMAVSAVGTK